MNNNANASDATSSRVIEEITFQASMLALRAAIESAAKGGENENSNEDSGACRQVDGQLHQLVERARRPAGGAESCDRLNLRGL